MFRSSIIRSSRVVWNFSLHDHVPFLFHILALIRPCLELFPSSIVPTFLPSIFHTTLTIILVSVSSSSFTLAVSMSEVYCVGYTPRAWDPCFLQCVLGVPLVFRSFATSSQLLKTLKPRLRLGY